MKTIERSNIREHLDPAVQPCEDFYRHANGRWLAATTIPADEAAWSAGHELTKRNREILREICEAAAADTSAPPDSITRKVGDFYASGMDEAASERAGLQPIAEELGRIDALDDHRALPALLARLHPVGARPGFRLFVTPDEKDSSRYLVQLAQAGLGLPDRDYYLKDDERSRKLLAEYEEHVARMLALLGAPADEARERAGRIRALETRFAHASMDRVTRRDPYKTYNKMSVDELTQRGRGFDWTTYFAALGAPAFQDVNVRQPDFIGEFAAVAVDVPLEDWRTYLRWHFIRARATELGSRLFDEWFGFYQRALLGVPHPRPRWERMVLATNAYLGEALGQLYVAKVFPAEAKRGALEMVEHLRATLRERILGLDWMQAATKREAVRKLDAFRPKIGYPDRWRDYAALEVDRGPFSRNVMRAERFESGRNLAKIGKPVDREEWFIPPPTVDAYYEQSLNEIVFPAGILQPPFFDFQADEALNYGAIGTVIGHEMTHGFDDQGSKYDADGNLREWWLPDDRKSYEARSELLVRQYEAYEPLPGMRINGRLTLGENIADFGGLGLAFAAFKRALAARGGGAVLDGFTPEQRFFLAYAQVWRHLVRDEALRVQLMTDPHSPARYRVVGPLANLPEFFEAFGCGANSTMRRSEERLTIW